MFFIIPCVDIYEKIDMRTQTFDVPPQEVRDNRYFLFLHVEHCSIQTTVLVEMLYIQNIFQILTKDSVTVFVNAIMYYKVKDATSAVANVDDYR